MSTIVTRASKGTPLTNNEVDANFTNLNTDKLETSAIGTLVPSMTGYNNSNWDTAYGWGNHALAGYLTGNQSISVSGDATGSGTTSIALTLANSGVTAGTYNNVATEVRPFTVDAKGRVTGIGTAVTIAPAFSSVTGKPTTLAGYGITDAQALDADLTAIAGLAGTSGLLKKTAANTWTLDTATYLTGNQSISVSGDATGSGATSIALTLANSGVAAGTYTKVTVDAKGRVTTGASLASADLPTYTGTLTSGQVTTALGFTPVQQGGGDGQGTNKLYIGWLGSQLGLKVDSTNFGATWPISVSGSAATLTTGRTIGMTGDVTWTSASFNGSANVTGTATLANSGVTAGTYNNSATQVTPLTVDAKGRVTATGTAVTITPDFSSVTGKPTTLAGYGITDAASFPTQTGNAGKFLTTNGSVVSWGSVDALPPQTGNAGKYLTTNGTTASWQTVVVPPTAPANAVASLNTVSSVNITFTAGLFADSHRIYYSTTNPPTTASSYVSATSSSGSVTSLAASTTYYFRVGAVNSAGIALSDTLAATTPPAGTTTYSAGQTLQVDTGGASGAFFCGADVTTMTVELLGGGGHTGGTWNQAGGVGSGGGKVAGVYTLGSNRAFTYYVGAGGLVGTEYWRGGAGGGASAVVVYGTFDAIAAAGGGGGGGAGWNGTAGAGTAGGSIVNQAGPVTAAAATPALVGSGGNPGAGRNGGKSNFMTGAGGGGASGYGEGGASNSSSSSYPGGGGGGGGYAGGAGGGNLGSAGGGGTGGTSYLAAGMAAANTTLSNSSGQVGTVKITFG